MEWKLFFICWDCQLSGHSEGRHHVVALVAAVNPWHAIKRWQIALAQLPAELSGERFQAFLVMGDTSKMRRNLAAGRNPLPGRSWDHWWGIGLEAVYAYEASEIRSKICGWTSDCQRR